MAKRSATNVELARTNSHFISADHGGLSKEELYGSFNATWLGREVEFTMEANRYRHSSGWSEWRIFVRGGASTDTMRAALNEAGRGLFEDYIASDAYTTSRQNSLSDMVRREIREERYSTNQAERLLDLVRDELRDEQVELLTETIEALDRFLGLLEATKTGATV